ncbi:polyamine ABC transporter ATP-binding protein [Rhodobaculum claviforme]|uniref:Polyamine ABC transporter ATP-binding protein n=2 Tax=Rhodobaculum claviforme TaxID=1549854 RepID=A0A934TN62_9RHOB|nr:polyamine ABC transporter ATP-binding protein [Rhodobaculum claviforme]
MTGPATTGPATADEIVRIEGLTKTYGAVRAVDDVSLSIPRGAFLTLLGASGSGKTTILMSIAGFVQPSAGRIVVAGRDITHVPANKRGLGMVFQGYALFPHMSVGDNVGFPLRVRGGKRAVDRDRVAQALALVQMDHLIDRMPDALSGGQQQRVALARALVFNPAILLLDEPLSALDKKLRADLQWELKELHHKIGTTFIYVTHDQDEALSMSDNIVILRDGRIEQSGAPGTLYHRPASRFVADFLGKSNFIPGTAAPDPSGGITVTTRGGQLLSKALADDEAAPAGPCLMALRPENITVTHTPLEGHNTVEGTITGVSFFGADHQIMIETPALGPVTARSHALRGAVAPDTGARVCVNWRPGDWRAVADR